MACTRTSLGASNHMLYERSLNQAFPFLCQHHQSEEEASLVRKTVAPRRRPGHDKTRTRWLLCEHTGVRVACALPAVGPRSQVSHDGAVARRRRTPADAAL